MPLVKHPRDGVPPAVHVQKPMLEYFEFKVIGDAMSLNVTVVGMSSTWAHSWHGANNGPKDQS